MFVLLMVFFHPYSHSENLSPRQRSPTAADVLKPSMNGSRHDRGHVHRRGYDAAARPLCALMHQSAQQQFSTMTGQDPSPYHHLQVRTVSQNSNPTCFKRPRNQTQRFATACESCIDQNHQ